MNIQTVTITVSDLGKSKDFYGDLLGFEFGDDWPETKWQSFRCGNQLLAIREKEGYKRGESFDITNFDIDDAQSLWKKVKDKAEIVEALGSAPWGSYRFVIKDPDGYWVAFVDKGKSKY